MAPRRGDNPGPEGGSSDPSSTSQAAAQALNAADPERLVLLEEYRDLRSEIAQRVSNHLVILGGVVVLGAALVPLMKDESMRRPVLLVIPIIFGTVSWLYFEQDIFLTQAATYINNHLRPQLSRRVADPSRLLGWEGFRNQVLFSRRENRVFLRIMTTFRLGATLGPGIAAVAIAPIVVLRQQNLQSVPTWQLVLYAVDLLVVGLLVFQGTKVVKLYRGIGE